MAEEDDGQLKVGFSVDNRKLARDFQQSVQVGDKTFDRMEGRAKQAQKRIGMSMAQVGKSVAGSMKGLAVSFGAGLLGGVAISSFDGIKSTIRDATKSLSEWKAEAARAGLDTSSFQELSYAAKQSGVSVDALTDGLKEMQLRADEFILTGAGSGAEAFQRLGFTAEELQEKLKKPDLLFEEIIGKLKRLDAASQIRIADEIFGGTGGEQFVRFLEAGRASIQDSRDEAAKFGLVWEKGVLDRADETTKKYEKLQAILDMRVKGAAVSAAQAFDDLIASAQRFLTELGNSDVWAKLQAGGNGTTLGRFLNAGIEQPTLLKNAPPQAGLEALKRAYQQGRKAGEAPAFDDWLSRADEKAARERAAIDPGAKPKKEKKSGGGKASPGEQFEKFLDRMRDQISSMTAEADAIARLGAQSTAAAREVELLSEARKAGVVISPQIEERIKAEAQAYGAAADRLGQVRDQQDRIQETQGFLADSMTDSLSGLITGTQSLDDTVKNLTASLVDAALQAALLGQGPLASLLGGTTGGSGGGIIGGLLGTAFGGFRAEGGPVSSSKGYIVGEKGPEYFQPGTSGRIVPNDALQAIRPPSVTSQQTINAPRNFAPNITLNTNGGGTPQANADLAKQIDGSLRQTFRQLYLEETRRAKRPNGALW